MNECNIGIVACESTHKAIEECVASLEGTFRIYPIVPSCTFIVGINLFKHYLDRSIIENDVTLLAYGTCHPQIMELLAEYGDQVVKVNGNNCFEMFLGAEKYAEYHGKSYWLLNEPFFTKWKKDVLVGWGAGTVNGKMLIEGAYKKVLYLRMEKDQLDLHLVEDFADSVGLEYEVHPVDMGNLKRLLEEALASVSQTRRMKLPASPLMHPSQPDVQTILENIGEIIYRIDVHTKEFTFISPQVETILGYTQMEFIDIINNYVIVPFYHEDEREKVTVGRYNFLVKCVNEGMREPYQVEYRVTHKNGNLLWVKESVYPAYCSEGVIGSFVGKIIDITERKRVQEALRKAHDDLEVRVKERTAELEALTEELRNEILERRQIEESLSRLNRAYLMVCECNQELIRITDEKSLLDKICRIITGTGGYRFVWVGFAEHDENKTVRPVASAGYEKGYLESVQITWADEPEGRGPTGTAIQTGKPTIARNILTDPQFAPWRDRAVKRGYASSIALPLHIDQENIGALNIYAEDPEAFDEEEVDLLIKLADNLAYGITSLRIRAEHKRAEEALRKSEERYRTVVEDMPALICRFRPDGTLSFVNSAYCQYFSKTYEELVGHNFFQFIPAEDRGKVRDHYNSINKERSAITYEHQVIAPDGTARWQRWTDRGLYNASGTLVEYQSIGEDITKRKQAEEALRESEGKYRSLVESTDDAVYLISRDMRYEFANGKYLSRLGLSLAELVGQEYGKLHPWDTNDEFAKKVDRVIKSGKPMVYEHLSHRDNKYFMRTLSPVIGEKPGEIRAITVTSKDITDRKRAEAELEATQEQLRNLSTHLQSVREEDRTSLAREIHDELGQALTVLKFGLTGLKNALPADQISLVEKVTSMAEYIDATAQTVNKIATQLRPTLLDELGLVEAIEWEVEEFENRTGIKCELTVEPEEMVVDRDRSTAIYRIVQEALTNIARHAQATRSAVTLKMSGGKLHLSITDNGIGIAEGQVLNPRSLGIIGMRERVLSVGGNFEINGIKERGTKVMVTIPIKVQR